MHIRTLELKGTFKIICLIIIISYLHFIFRNKKELEAIKKQLEEKEMANARLENNER